MRPKTFGILWGWLVPPLNAEVKPKNLNFSPPMLLLPTACLHARAQSLPREVTWNAELQQLCYALLEEQAAMRTKILPTTSLQAGTTLTAGRRVILGSDSGGSQGWPHSARNQSEVLLSFEFPTQATVFGLVGMATEEPASSDTFFFVD